MAIEATAPAKVNLALHVTGRRSDGHHLLDSIVVFADIGDGLRFEPAPDMALTVSGPFAAGVPTDGANLILRAAALLAKAGQGARITLEKRLPHGGGIGGGSSDAAAALKALARLWDASVPEVAAVLTLGADVPVCLCAPKPQRMQGIGEDLTPLPPLPEAHLVLVSPGIPLPTGQVFASFAAGMGTESSGLTPMPEAPDFDSFAAWLGQQRNDLEAPAVGLAPAISDALEALRAMPECRLARMSGSGSTVFGLFEARASADLAAARLSSARPSWWVRAARVLTPSD
jgi:4-diphosphocytidyl-2-C-methyl-D-erythritol kinase